MISFSSGFAVAKLPGFLFLSAGVRNWVVPSEDLTAIWGLVAVDCGLCPWSQLQRSQKN